MPPNAKYKKAPTAQDPATAEDFTRYSNLSAEKSLLSLLLKHGNDYWTKADELNIAESHFYSTPHRTLYRLLRQLHQTHGQLDINSIASLIPETDLTTIGGLSTLAEIYTYDSLTSYWDHYTSQLQETYNRRTTDTILRKAITDLKTGFAEPEDILRRLTDTQHSANTPRPYLPMGRQGESFVYYVPDRGELVTLAKNDHRTQALLSLAPLTYWETRYGELRAETATNECFQAQGNRLFSPDSARGIGTWKEQDNIIYNAGDTVLTYAPDGTSAERKPMGNGIIYERKTPIIHPHHTPLTDDESTHIVKYFQEINWNDRECAILLVGWLAIAPLAGCLKFRPHAWLNAPSGSGKSQLLDIIKHLLGTYSLNIEGGTTEAGLRQTLRLDARCGIFDEAEANGENGAKTLERILSYLRSCSTNDGGSVLKGTTNGKATVSSPRSMFLFGSIGNQLERASDESRFATVSIRKIYDQNKLQTHLQKLAELRTPLYTPHYPQRLLARILTHAQTTLRNIDTIRTHMIQEGEPGRRADLMAPMLAGCHSLIRTTPITLQHTQELHNYVKSSHIATIRETDETRCLNHLLQYITKDGWSIIELIESVWREPSNFENCDHHLILKRHGVKVFKEEAMIAIADCHSKLTEVFDRSDFTKGWGRILRNLKDAKERVSVRFSASAHATKATKIPIPDMKDNTQKNAPW